MEINKSSGQVEIIGPYGRIYLYTHDHADKLLHDVYQTLKQGTRWDDEDYLSKMVFCHMVPQEQWLSDKGYGIGTQMYTDINILITLDVPNQTIAIGSATDRNTRYVLSFQDFILGYSTQAKL